MSDASGRDASRTDPVWRRAEIESPCIKVCVLHPASGLCVGCFRTGAEIGAWSRLSAEARRAIMAELPERGAALTRRGSVRRARPRGDAEG